MIDFCYNCVKKGDHPYEMKREMSMEQSGMEQANMLENGKKLLKEDVDLEHSLRDSVAQQTGK